jgi:hypothetical protein
MTGNPCNDNEEENPIVTVTILTEMDIFLRTLFQLKGQDFSY